jgi:hypothetical protein
MRRLYGTWFCRLYGTWFYRRGRLTHLFLPMVPGAVRLLGVITFRAPGREQTLTQATDRVLNKLRHQGL